MSINTFIHHPQAFRRGLLIPTDSGPRPFSTVADPWQERDFAALDLAWLSVAGRGSPAGCLFRAMLTRPRGHSKTSDIALQTLWALFASPSFISGVAAAADRDQAAILRRSIWELCEANAWLREIFDVKAYEIENKRTGSKLEIISADARSSYGLRPHFIVCDELSHWQSRDLWDSLFSSAAKRKNCLLLIIQNAGFIDSWQGELKAAVDHDPAWYYSHLGGPQASWIDADVLAEQQRLLPPLAYSRLWLNQWSAGSGDALDPRDIDAAVTLPGPSTSPEPGWVYCGALDIGTVRDATAFAVLAKHVGHTETIGRELEPEPRIVRVQRDLGHLPPRPPQFEYIHHQGSGRVKLVDLHVWQPRGGSAVDLSAVERTILAAHDQFHLATVGFDPHQAIHLSQRLYDAGVQVQKIDFVASNLKQMTTATLEAFGQRTIDLFNHPALLADLRNLRIAEKTYGVRLESPRVVSTSAGTPHGDCATALSIGLMVASGMYSESPYRIEGELVCWP